MTDHVDVPFIRRIMDKVLAGGDVEFAEAEQLLTTENVVTLSECANTITRKFAGDVVDVETLINAKSGRCPEDCSFCAQSAFYDSHSGINRYPLLPKQVVIDQAKKAQQGGATSFCLVCAYRSPPEEEFEKICDCIEEIKRTLSIDVNVSLGFITLEKAKRLKSLGVKRYNHNLETSETFFRQICKTHDFFDRVRTAKIVKEAGLELCCGGIIGLGETPIQRIELAFAIRSLRADEVPINILIARQGTPLAYQSPINPADAIKTIAVWRFIMPGVILKIAGGREIHLTDQQPVVLKSGANGIISGGYLTTGGNKIEEDLSMVKSVGLKTKQSETIIQNHRLIL